MINIKNRYLIYFIIAGLFFGMFLGAFVHNVKGASTGSLSPEAEGSVYNEWTNGQNVYTQNDVYATSTSQSTANDNDVYNFDIELINYDSILGIVVSVDGYASGLNTYTVVSISWNGGSSWTATKNSANFGTSDTDTYINIGSETDNWGRSWSANDFSNDNFRIKFTTTAGLIRTLYYDHIYINIFYEGYPSELVYMYCVNTNCSKNVNISCIGSEFNFDDDHDYIRIQRKTTDFPSSIGDGENIHNGTLPMDGAGNFYKIDTTVNYNTLYYYSIWAYNLTYKLWSDNSAKDKIRIPCQATCNSSSLTVYNNTKNVAGSYTTKYDSVNGWKVYLNLTGKSPVTFFNNTKNTTGSYTSKFDYDKGYYIYLNYTGKSYSIILYENIVNASGTHEYTLKDFIYKVYANYTGNITSCPSCNSTDINLFENLINCTGTLEYEYNNITGFKIWANYTGNISISNCTGIYWFNYSDGNITINISFNKATNNYDTSDYSINEDSWLYLAGALLLDNAQFFIIILLSLWLFFVTKYLDTRDLSIAYVTLGLSFPLSIIIATISLDYPFGFIIVFLIPILSIVFIADKYYRKK